MPGSSHRSTWLKQTNKKHKGSNTHKSKRAVSRQTNGRVSRSDSTSTKKSGVTSASRKDRQNKAKLIRDKKRSNIIAERRKAGIFVAEDFELDDKSVGFGSLSAPVNVGIVSLSEKCNAIEVARALNLEYEDTKEANESNLDFKFPAFMSSKKHKSKVSIFAVAREMFAVLDAARVSDVLVLLVSAKHDEEEVSSNLDDILAKSIDVKGRSFLDALKSQGLPTIIGGIQSINTVKMKLQSKVKSQVTQFFLEEIGRETKVISLEDRGAIDGPDIKSVMDMEASTETVSEKSANSLFRALIAAKYRHPAWRNLRSHLLAADQHLDDDKSVQLEGYLRGKPLNVHSLVHLPGIGNFRIQKVEALPSAFANTRRQPKGMEIEMPEMLDKIIPDPSRIQDLKSRAEPDMFANDQTWPTEEELQGVNHVGDKDDEAEYRAAWGVDDIDSGSEISNDDPTLELNAEKPQKKVQFKAHVIEKDVDMDAEVSLKLKELRKAEANDQQFPDEIEVPHDMPARHRFAKYRGLKSFKDSFWHPKESLPREYGYINELDNPQQIVNTFLAELNVKEQIFLRSQEDSNKISESFTLNNDNETLLPGRLYRFHLFPSPDALEILRTVHDQATFLKVPLTMFSLLPHEQKLTVVTASVKRVADSQFDEPIQSKDPILVQCGFWRSLIRPVFSDNTPALKKHKFLKFLPRQTYCSATFYGPVTYGQTPVLLFSVNRGLENVSLAASGILPCEDEALDCNRIILKRVVLTGYPVRVKKNKAVIRFMFHNPEDVMWFRPVQLWTKDGAVGEILESLGTHGLLKARFDRLINSADTVCLSLYKRIFPKFVDDNRTLE